MTNAASPITVAYGDGIGPEIMGSVIKILKEAEAPIRIESVDIGSKLYEKNYKSGIDPDSWEVITRNPVLLKAPITTPQSGGCKSINVTLRKMLDLYANIRPVKSYEGVIANSAKGIDLTVIRENSEDLYAGIEHRQSAQVFQSLKLISKFGSRRISDFAFNYANTHGYKKLSCFTKDNIMKLSDGAFRSEFEEVAKSYKSIKTEHLIIDIAAALVATDPARFDVVVTSNLYGDIISDIAAAVAGSVGLAGSANIGDKFAMFEAVHGSAPDIAGKNIANPSGLLNAAVMMLVHLGHKLCASLIENAWKKTLEDGIHTADIYDKSSSKRKVSTDEFTDAVIERLGQNPSILKKASYNTKQDSKLSTHSFKKDEVESILTSRNLVGVDIFIGDFASDAQQIASKIQKLDLTKICDGKLQLQQISSMGLKLWPHDSKALELPGRSCDHWCARFVAARPEIEILHQDIATLTFKLCDAGINFIKCENLYDFSGEKGYSRTQGE